MDIKVKLSRGELSLRFIHQLWSFDALLGLAERINPKRAFLFVSKVLGRHIPVSPTVIRQAFSELSDQIPDQLPEPILLIGMAETAVGLAAGVHQRLLERYPKALFLATTRHPIDAPLISTFNEEHSHAPVHLLHGSFDEHVQSIIRQTRTLIMVDDEVSTGKTFINLAKALQAEALPALSHVVTATLTDWSPPLAFDGFTHQSVSLFKGQWTWDDFPNALMPTMPKVNTVAVGLWPVCNQHTWGRTPTYQPQLELELTAEAGQNILVLGSNEFVWPPFLLAEKLAAQGANVKFSSTTRSPILVGHSIKSVISFNDNYGLGMVNFVYNVDWQKYDRVVLAIETAVESLDPQLYVAIPNLEVISCVK